MDMSRWLSEMGMEDSDFIAENPMNTFGDLTSEHLAAAVGGEYLLSHCPSFSQSQLELEATQSSFESPAKQTLTPERSASLTEPPHGKLNSPKVSKGKGNKRAIKSPPSCPQDHVIAERKRRERLSQQFIALTAIVPGLKKTDKTSVLGDSIMYLKKLQERLKSLEEQTAKKKMEAVTFVQKSHIPSEDENDPATSNEELPEIEARVSGRNVLIRIRCEKQRGVMIKIIGEIEKLNLCVVNSGIIPFGASTLYITVQAGMDEGFNIAVNELVKNLRSSLLLLM